MDVKISKRISRLFFTAVISITFQAAQAQLSPQLAFSENKVWVKNLDREILYTFLRYNGLQSDWKEVFPVLMKSDENIPLAGRYEFFETSVSFTPEFPFIAGVPYAATLYLEELTRNYNEIYLPKTNSGALNLKFSLTAEQSKEPVVTAVYPSSNILPENLLKFHIAFNTSMTLGEIYKRVKLVNSKGKVVEKAFLVLDQELWDEEMKIVTLLFDPGRIKRGLRPNLEMGTALRSNEKYILRIEPGWKNVNGTPTKQTFEKVFTCSSSDRQVPDHLNWDLITPTLPASPLIIKLKENFDFVMLNESFIVLDGRGHRVDGKIEILNNESVIAFTPTSTWNNDNYTLYINPLLEDLAGNNLNRLFDEDLTRQGSENENQKVISRNFSVELTQH